MAKKYKSVFSKPIKKKPRKQRLTARQRREARQEEARLLYRYHDVINQYKEPSKPTIPEKKNTLFEQVKASLEYIHKNDKLNVNEQLSNKIEEAITLQMREELGTWDPDFMKQRATDLYEIDVDWDGNPNSLISHITLKRDITNPDARGALEDIVNSNWGSEEKHQKYLDEASSLAYSKNKEKVSDIDKVPTYMLGILEDIMNSSAVWHIIGDRYGLATRGVKYESGQAEKDWTTMHRDVQNLMSQKGGVSASDLDELLDLIYNYDDKATRSESEYNKLRDKIDEMLNKYRVYKGD